MYKIPATTTAIHKCSAKNPTALEEVFKTKLRTLPIIPGKAIYISSAILSNKLEMFFNHPGSGFGGLDLV